MTRPLARFGWFLISVAALVAVLAFPSFYSEMIWALKKPQISGIDERLTNIKPEHAPWLKEQVMGKWGRYGWYLHSGETGWLRIDLPGSLAGIIKMRIWAFSAGQFSAHVTDGHKVHEIPVGSLDGQILNIPVSGPSELVVRASNDLSEQQLVLDRISVAWYASSDQLPSLWLFGVSCIFVMVGWGVIIWHGKDANKWRLWVGTLLILIITIMGIDQRWKLLEMTRGLPVDPDVVAYMAYAQNLDFFTTDHGFYSGTFSEREPLHVAALHLWLKLWGKTTSAIRWYSVVLSIILVAASGIFLWALSKRWSLGAIGASLIAFNQPDVIANSP